MSEVVTTDPLQELANRAAKAKGATFAALAVNAAVVEGRSVTDKAALIGVPFIITSASFTYRGKLKDGTVYDSVALELTTIDDIETVINDSGTGVRRQIVQYLDVNGYNTMHGEPDWAIAAEPGQTIRIEFDGTIPVLAAPRGLRVSEYSNDYTEEGKTYYLA